MHASSLLSSLFYLSSTLMSQYVLAIHGGAGTISRESLTPSVEQDYREALARSLIAGSQILAVGGSAVRAVEAAVCVMEDSPIFNAGKGSVYTCDERHEMEASIMCGYTRNAGAAALIRTVRNPIQLARSIMEASGHVMLVGEGAEQFAREQQLAMEAETYFDTEARYQQLLRARERAEVLLDHSGASKMGTVGAVALDQSGNLAAATSTGGMTNKAPGRLGDSALVGAGTYADNDTCAVSCTGHGEYFIRGVVAYDVACLMAYSGLSLAEAAARVIHKKQPEMGGSGGLIAINATGHLSLPFNSSGMYRGWVREGESLQTAIFDA